MTPESERPVIFSFTNYREYLASVMAWQKSANAMSARAFARQCGITSPNYLQQVIGARRNLTSAMAARIAASLDLGSTERSYLMAMLKLDSAQTPRARESVLKSMREMIRKSARQRIDEHELHSSWVNGVVWEILKTKDGAARPSIIRDRLRQNVDVNEIEAALALFRRKGLLKEGDAGKAVPAAVDFRPSNDIRRIDIQRSHLRFLQIAQHRLNDPIQDREFQGLTVAIKRESFNVVRDLCREFIHAINDQYAVDCDADEVIRVQLCAFRLTKD